MMQDNQTTNETPNEKSSLGEIRVDSLNANKTDATSQSLDTRVEMNSVGDGPTGDFDEGPPDCNDLRAWMITLGVRTVRLGHFVAPNSYLRSFQAMCSSFSRWEIFFFPRTAENETFCP
jgi:hypothetical protein